MRTSLSYLFFLLKEIRLVEKLVRMKLKFVIGSREYLAFISSYGNYSCIFMTIIYFNLGLYMACQFGDIGFWNLQVTSFCRSPLWYLRM